ncbi:McrB family protein [Neobacillus niacini]|uniref:McrB family protein n=1 Tax=Neobacillus niacini TaxID=86668 RepID=UPI0021CAF752|nr:AAA family ATPase [Neobacillus niacini]MCM3768134.1 AAA family ATPase [Neobacillus niacini]
MVETIVHLNDDEELLSYFGSFKGIQDFLLNEEIYNVKVDAIEKLISFIKEGTKKRRKQNFKAYFSAIDINEAKGLASILEELKAAVESEQIEPIKKVKDGLISQGMLVFNKKYLDIFPEKSSDNYIEVTQKNSEIEDPNNLDKYFYWLNYDVNDLRNELLEAYQNKSLNSKLVRKFVGEFKKFLNGRLLLKVISLDARQIVGVPILLKMSGYDILPHPFLDNEWELSRPVETLSNQNRINVGDIVAANFTASRNEHFISSLLFVDFDGAEVIPQTLQQALSEYVDSDYIEEAYKVFEIKNNEDEEIKSFLLKKLLQTSENVRNLLSDDLKKLNEKRNDIAKAGEDISKEEINLEQNRKIWHKILKRIDELIELEEGYQLDEDGYEKVEYQPEQFIFNLQSLFYHNDEQHLIYKTGIIKSFVYALQSNILTLIAGPSGTGKSSIVQAFGRAVKNVEVRMIPVQSSWTDAQDLLGYFHPTDKAFVPTPFMEAMAEAALEKNKSKLFLICLDEMNLAHIEYYFSEILSAREEKTPTIRLYPKRYLEIAKHTLINENASIEQQKNAEELIKLYPPIFKIPDNVRFIGTLNMDHTVKPISPKVIDRSFIIEIDHLKSQEKEEIKSNLQFIDGKIEMDYETFKLPILDEIKVNDAVEKIQEVSLLFDEYPNASLNSRGYKHIRQFLTFAKNEQEKNELIDYIILGKILPRIEIKKTELDKITDNLIQIFTSYSLAHEKLKDMLNTKHIVKFW